MFRKLNLVEHSACNSRVRLLVFRKFVPKQRANEMGATWGYARVSSEDQELGLQISALRAAGSAAHHMMMPNRTVPAMSAAIPANQPE